MSSPKPTQPWDRETWTPPTPAEVSAALEPHRRRAVEASLGHYPAIFAILDCVAFGVPQSFEGAIRSEMASFSHLVLRPEPRAMIQTMFLGRVDFERLDRMHELPEVARAAVALVKSELVGGRGLGARAPPMTLAIEDSTFPGPSFCSIHFACRTVTQVAAHSASRLIRRSAAALATAGWRRRPGLTAD